jgi:transposase
MPTNRITMRQIRQALRLHLEAGLSYAQIARAVGIGKGTVGKFMLLARAAGVDWAVAQTLSDAQLEARLYRPAVPRSSRQLEPDFAWIHQELKRPGVTLQLLWEEYQRDAELAYKYTSFCVKYRAWAQALKRSMRQTHIAGERLFVDYAGQTVPVVADWVGSIIGALEFIGGVPRLIVPDQTRALIARPDRYEPAVNRLVDELCEHYDVAVLPARPAHPRDKPKVEVGVQVVERWILARLRNRRFFSLADLNAAIGQLLLDLNQRAFKKLPGCRASAFEALDRRELRPLPATRMAIARFKRARVNIDYHVELDGHYYSVPHRLVRAEVELRVTATTVEILAGNQRVAVHAYSSRRGAHTTLAEHMPASHRAQREWTPQRLIAWGLSLGAATAAVVRWQMEHRPHPEQGYRACLGLQRLARQFGTARLEAACARALSIRSPTYRSVNSILAAGLDRQQVPAAPAQAALPLHENVRGPDYYH